MSGPARDRPRRPVPAPARRRRFEPGRALLRLLPGKGTEDARALRAELAETGRLLRRGRRKLSPHAVAEVEALRAVAAAALASGDEGRMAGARAHLAEGWSRHLAPFRKSLLREAVETVGPAVALAVLLRLFVVEAFQIPSGSMAPTLLPGDQLFVSKVAYGLRAPFGGPVLLAGTAPRRGEVVVFRDPDDDGRLLVKRVAAIAGDTVELREETLWINGVAQPRVLVEERHEFWNQDDHLGYWRPESGRRFLEELDGRRHQTLQARALDVPRPPAGPYHVPAGHVFVLGDNRDNSEDGREGDGRYVPVENLQGKALFTWFSWGRGGLSFTGEEGVRPERIGLAVDGAAADGATLEEAAELLRRRSGVPLAER